MQTVAVVGYSNTGKTMVTGKLITWFSNQGIKVAAVKHASHGYNVDVAGTDSHSHYAAGASAVVVAGPDSYTLHRRTSSAIELDSILEHLGDCDLVLVEGYKMHPGPKVELLRCGISEKRLGLQGVVAVVTDLPDLHSDEPIFAYTEIDQLGEYLWQDVLKRKFRK